MAHRGNRIFLNSGGEPSTTAMPKDELPSKQAESLARSGVTLNIRETNGSVQDHELPMHDHADNLSLEKSIRNLQLHLELV